MTKPRQRVIARGFYCVKGSTFFHELEWHMCTLSDRQHIPVAIVALTERGKKK